MIKRLLHKPCERDWTVAADQIADVLDERLIGHAKLWRVEALKR
jgi:hypothetical protein